MTARAVTLNLPQLVYERFQRRAEKTDRTIEAELLDVVAAAPVVNDDFPAKLEEELASLALLDDERLWLAARSRMPDKEAELIAKLNYKQQRDGLKKAELATLNHLGREYDRYLLIRAEAAVLLKRRGVDISELGPKR
jgi:hypothetical protein